MALVIGERVVGLDGRPAKEFVERGQGLRGECDASPGRIRGLAASIESR
ncbi:hypothetical protein [Streptomyces sp. NPDC059781]